MSSLSQAEFHQINEEIRKAKALALVAEYIRPKDHSVLHRPKPASAETLAGAKLAIATGMVPQLFKDFLDQVNSSFHIVEMDIEAALGQMHLEEERGHEVQWLMDELLERLNAWWKGWSSPLKVLEPGISSVSFDGRAHFDFMLTGATDNRSSKNTRIVEYTTHFMNRLHAFLPQTTFAVDLLKYFRMAMPIPTAGPENQIKPASFKPNPYLYRFQIIPKYINLLAQMAYECVDSLVWKQAGPCSAVDKLILQSGARKIELPEMELREENWTHRKLGKLREDIAQVVMTWLDEITRYGDHGFQKRSNVVTRLDYRMQGVLFELRAVELFDIIVQYPESAPALEDLKECLAANRTERRAYLVQELSASIKKRLLHPGPRTPEVIDAYVSTIRALRLLDSQGVLLHAIAQPIRNHLKIRPDTIKTIAKLLVNGSDTMRDVEGDDEAKPINLRDDAAEDFTDQNWEPEPIDAAPEFRSKKASDIISTLVGITHDRTLIITELSELLSQRLLAVKDYDLDQEIRTVEILKLRFGEAALPKCEVMLKDFAESKRIDSHVQSMSPSVLHPIILSRHYWPEIAATPLCIPRKLQDMQKMWNAYYARHKQGRHLQWRPQAGTVGMKIELRDRVVQVEATTMQAGVLHCFEHKNTRKIGKIAEKLGVEDTDELEKAINFWVNHGVLGEITKGRYGLIEEGGAQAEEGMAGHELEASPAPVLEPAAETRAELENLHWPEIQIVMQSSGPSTATVIQAMLLQRLTGFNDTVGAIEATLLRAEREGLVNRLMESDGTSFWQSN